MEETGPIAENNSYNSDSPTVGSSSPTYNGDGASGDDDSSVVVTGVDAVFSVTDNFSTLSASWLTSVEDIFDLLVFFSLIFCLCVVYFSFTKLCRSVIKLVFSIFYFFFSFL